MAGSATVTFKWNKAFWGECMTSPGMAAALQGAANVEMGRAESRIGTPSHKTNLRNPNFTTRVATRHGSSSDYFVGLVIAANPRSIYKAQHGQAFN